MRLLYVCSDFGIAPDGTKGASVHLRAITRALCESGHEVMLLSPKEGPAENHPVKRLLADGCPPADQTSRLLKRWLQDHDLSDSIARELRPLIYNAWVHGRALEALAGDLPDAIVERLSLLGHVGLDLAEAIDVPLVVEVNAPLAEEARRFRSLQLTDLANEIQRRILARADAVVTVSRTLADHLCAGGVSQDKVHVVPNGADVARFQEAPTRETCRAKLGFENEFVVGFAGSLKQWHGVDLLLAAFRRLHQEAGAARLLIVGAGPTEVSLREAVATMKLGNAVTFTGAVPHARMPELIGAMDVAVAPFRRVEPFYFSPIKVFEYMASGVCIVASALGQLAEVIEDGVNGLLCVPDDEQDLYSKLRVAWQSPDLRRRLGSSARQSVQTRHTWSQAAQKTSRVIQAAMDKRSDVAAGVGTQVGPGLSEGRDGE